MAWWSIALAWIAPRLHVVVTPSVVALLLPAAVVKVSAIAEILGTSVMTESSIRLVVVIPRVVLVILVIGARSVCLVRMVRVVLSFVSI